MPKVRAHKVVVTQMPKRKKKSEEKQGHEARLNIWLTPELSQRVEAYCIRRAQREGRIQFGLKHKLARAALEEWLDKHEDDVDMEL
jgi:hypothetical protein